MRNGGRALGVVLLSTGAVAGCTAPAPRKPAEPPAERPAPPRPRFPTLESCEPTLVRLEDRRAFDPGLFESMAASPDPAARAMAALAMGRIGDERAEPLLRSLLADASPEVREMAAFGAGILGHPPLTEALAPLLSDPESSVAVRAAWAIGLLEAPAGQEALEREASRASSSPQRQAACLRALWRFSNTASERAARSRVDDPDASVRAAALYALARRPRESALPVLTGALADPNPDTAALAGRALGLLARPESVASLSSALGDPRPPVRIAVLLALSAVLEKNPGAEIPAEARARVLPFAGDANPNVAVPALALLRWSLDDRDVFSRLWRVASSGEGRRRQVALQSLMAGIGSRSVPVVDAAMQAEDPFLRAAVAEALSFLPEGEAAPRRQQLAADPELVVRVKVIEGLRTAELVRASRALVDAGLSSDAPALQATAIDALALLEEPAVLPVIREAVVRSYAGPSPDVAIEAIGVAEKQADRPEARAIVEAAYRHPATLVSRLARRCLVRSFRADPAAWPLREYDTGKSVSDYAALLSEARRGWTARIETVRGEFRVRLAAGPAPLTVLNFVSLSRRNFFDGVAIHRVVPGYVVQDGDPTGTGSGGPGYEIRDENDLIPYGAGTVGMALAGPDTGGSQWFVTQEAEPHLDGIYTAFGRVSSGLDVVRRIEQGDRILRVTVEAEGP
jgi:cyclophilin family peptidyl-prolyl cis-trans isomerase/HEAT repeat protein